MRIPYSSIFLALFLTAISARAGADDHLTVRIQEHTGHKVNPESEREAMDGFVQNLKP